MKRGPSHAFPTFPLDPPARRARANLDGALLDLQQVQRSTPCMSDPEPFTSDDREERAEAAQACLSCPTLALCRAYAEAADESEHVWAGVDRSTLRGGGAQSSPDPSRASR